MRRVNRSNWLARNIILFGPNQDTNKLRIFTDAVGGGEVFDPSWVFSDASVMTVDWGDGTPKESHATALNHTYAAGTGRKQVRFSCPDWTRLTDLDINTDVCRLSLPSLSMCTALSTLRIYTNQFSGAIPSFATCIGLTLWYVAENQFTGTLPSFATCVNLGAFWIGNNQFGGIIPNFAPCTALTYWDAAINAFTGYVVGGFATQRDLNTLSLATNNLPEASIDAILADCVTSLAIPARVVCTLSLNGIGNSAPSAAGLADKATLVAAGWTVNTN